MTLEQILTHPVNNYLLEITPSPIRFPFLNERAFDACVRVCRALHHRHQNEALRQHQQNGSNMSHQRPLQAGSSALACRQSAWATGT
jgi:hypothetical protein